MMEIIHFACSNAKYNMNFILYFSCSAVKVENCISEILIFLIYRGYLHFFEVNTKYISSRELKTSEFSRAQHE